MEVGKLGEIFFESGYYAYIGSSMSGLKNRLRRHFSRKKKKRWHIDYLMENASCEGFFAWQSRKNIEDKIACKLKKKFEYIEGFGSSDSRCDSHLFYSKDRYRLLKALFRALRRQSIFVEF